jgi:predicted 3-demethylubiquinone-9 3-methyltransferase (glyoxalase superfamily)
LHHEEHVIPIAQQKITPCLWFDTEAEDAANFYCSIFDNSKIDQVSHYVDAGQEVHGKKASSVMVVAFPLEGQKFVPLNAVLSSNSTRRSPSKSPAPRRRRLTISGRSSPRGGGQEGPCGWLKDRFGVSWQVVSTPLIDMMLDKDASKVARVTNAFLIEEVRSRGADARL